MVEVTGIYKSYKNREILKGASFTAEPGKCTGIVGVNGCGKTTLLSIVAGAAKADRGTVRHTEKTAYVPQEMCIRDSFSPGRGNRLCALPARSYACLLYTS